MITLTLHHIMRAISIKELYVLSTTSNLNVMSIYVHLLYCIDRMKL